MTNWIEFGRGPLFRLCFALMVLGLVRILVLTLMGVYDAFRRSPDKIINWKEVRQQTLGWLFPLDRLLRLRPIYSLVSFVFHVGLIVTPLFLAAHVLLWRNAVGFGWPAVPQVWANWLTRLAIIAGVGLFLGRVLHAAARQLSRAQDLLWPLLLLFPFLTGYIASNAAIGPKTYQELMLIHIYAGDLIMLLIPFTKIAHCVLMPLSQVVTAVAWKFPAGAGDRVTITLGVSDRPTWVAKSRLSAPLNAPEPALKGGPSK